MRLIKPSIKLEWMTPNALDVIERAGRTCYQSESQGEPEKFVNMVMDRGHLSVIEHASMSYRIVCDRGVTHELVRHRLFSYSQESTRYCRYDDQVTFIIPPWVRIDEGDYPTEEQLLSFIQSLKPTDLRWFDAVALAERSYSWLLTNGWSPQQARSVLPNSLKTEIVVTGNFREWQHFFKLRTAETAHPQMREVVSMILIDASTRIKEVFDR